MNEALFGRAVKLSDRFNFLLKYITNHDQIGFEV